MTGEEDVDAGEIASDSERYDFGSVSTPMEYFDNDFGELE